MADVFIALIWIIVITGAIGIVLCALYIISRFLEYMFRDNDPDY